MMEKTNVKVFIASSAEVKDQRKECILILNQINKSHPHLDLEPVEWEYDIPHGSYPDFKGVQKAINPLLKPCKFCIFMFYSKIGKYTLEEFTLATKLKKKLFAFFKEGFSPKTKDEIAKWTELITFKEGMNDTILYGDYHTITEFELLMTQNLHLYLSQEFPPPTIYENKPLSPDVSKLIHLLTEKEEEIKQLKKSKRSLPDGKTKKQLALLEKEKDNLRNELQQNREIQEQQAKEKQELEQRLATQIANDKLKQQALIAVQENRYDEAKEFLKESAKDSMIEAASKIYELGKISKIQLLYKDALNYFELAAKMNPSDFQMNMEAGSMLRDSGYNDKAIIHFEKALQLLEPGNSQDDNSLSHLYNELGIAYRKKALYDKAIEYYTIALTLDKKFYGEEHPDIAIDYNNIGLVYRHKGEYDKAIKYYTQGLTIDKKFYGEEHPNIAVRYNNIGQAYDDKGEYDKAIEFYNKALVLDKKFYGEEHPKIAIRYCNIGEPYRKKGEHDKAIKYYTQALSIDKKFYGEEHPHIAVYYNNIGAAYDDKGEYNKAIRFYDMALVLDKKFYGEEHPSIATRYNNFGLTYNNKGEYDKAIECYQKALSIFIKFLGENHPSTLTVKENLEAAREALANSKK